MEQAGARAREEWIDVAKGLAIVLVVFFHAVMYPRQLGLDAEWVKFTYTLDTFRMPLFFFLSGLLAAGVVQAPLSTLFRRRMLRLLYLYVVWCTLQRLFVWLMPPSSLTPPLAEPSQLVTILIVPHPNLWFIYALPLFFLLAWATRRLPPVAVLAGAAVVAAVFAPGLSALGSGPWGKTGRYLFFFLAAIHLSRLVRERAPRVRAPQLAVSGAVYLGVVAALTFTDLRSVPFAVLAGGIVAVTFGVCLAVVLTRTGLSGPLQFLGRRTLPIYLVHTFPMIAVAALLRPFLDRLPASVGLVLPLLLTALGLTSGLLADRYLHRVPGLLDLPAARWRQRPPASATVSTRQPAVSADPVGS